MLGDRVDSCDYSVDSSFFHRHADEVVEFPGADEREEVTFALATVAFQDLNGGSCQIDLYDTRTLFLVLLGMYWTAVPFSDVTMLFSVRANRSLIRQPI